jgi:hypothetical protein
MTDVTSNLPLDTTCAEGTQTTVVIDDEAEDFDGLEAATSCSKTSNDYDMYENMYQSHHPLLVAIKAHTNHAYSLEFGVGANGGVAGTLTPHSILDSCSKASTLGLLKKGTP